MSARTRKFIGSMGMILYVFVYALLVMKLMTSLPRQPMLIELLLYVFFGLVWILPLKPLFRWMGQGR